MTADALDLPGLELEISDPLTVQRISLWRRATRSPTGLVSMAVIGIFVIVGVLAPWIAPYDPNHTNVLLTNEKPFTSEFVLGGDAAGRDVLSRLIWSARGTLLAISVVLVVSMSIGATAGLVAGYRRGTVETVANWISDALLALPGVVLLIGMYSVIGPSILLAMAVYGLMIAPFFYRIVRSVALGVSKELYIDAARVAGLSSFRIVFRHVLGAVRGPIVVSAAFVLGAGISIQATLEFLGLGSSREASWGGMLRLSFNSLYVNPENVIIPALTIVLAIVAFVLLGNVMRDEMQAATHHKALPMPRRRQLDVRLNGQSTGLPSARDVLLDVSGLRIGYFRDERITEVVAGVDLRVKAGEIHGLVGESGSGKSQTAFALLGILPREALITAGRADFNGVDLIGNPAYLVKSRGRSIGYIPQEPMTNLDPSITIGRQLTQGLRATRRMSRVEAKAQLLALLERVGIRDVERVWRMHPHEISGGMAQRVLIAGAIAPGPDLIIADEPTTALDVTVQAELLDLLRELQAERQMAMIFVTHNFGVVADICDTVSVMKDGLIVESAPVVDLFQAPSHPYTQQLLASAADATAA